MTAEALPSTRIDCLRSDMPRNNHRPTRSKLTQFVIAHGGTVGKEYAQAPCSLPSCGVVLRACMSNDTMNVRGECATERAVDAITTLVYTAATCGIRVLPVPMAAHSSSETPPPLLAQSSEVSEAVS